jgi:stringent starvation protein B
MSELSTKPYLLRAIYEWCTDSGYTPYLAVRVDGNTRVPMEFVRNGEIVLNISFAATNGLKMENDHIRFSARFGGVSRDLYIPVDNVLAIYANENNQGMAFDVVSMPEEGGGFGVDDGAIGLAPPVVAPSEPTPLASVPTLSSVPTSSSDDEDEGPEPPKKGGGKPTLTRIK